MGCGMVALIIIVVLVAVISVVGFFYMIFRTVPLEEIMNEENYIQVKVDKVIDAGGYSPGPLVYKMYSRFEGEIVKVNRDDLVYSVGDKVKATFEHPDAIELTVGGTILPIHISDLEKVK